MRATLLTKNQRIRTCCVVYIARVKETTFCLKELGIAGESRFKVCKHSCLAKSGWLSLKKVSKHLLMNCGGVFLLRKIIKIKKI